MPTLEAKVAVVSGASRGIGRATTIALARAGASVFAGARNVSTVASLAAEHPTVHALELDVRDPASVRAFADRVLREHGVDIVVNNAGVGSFGPIEEISVEEWDRIFEVNARGTFLVTQAFLPSIRARGGHFVNVTSDVSARTFGGGSLYTASKHAQRAFTRALQMELADAGARVTEVRPGSVATEFAASAQAPSEHALAAEDVADAIVYAVCRPGRMRMDELHFHPNAQPPAF